MIPRRLGSLLAALALAALAVAAPTWPVSAQQEEERREPLTLVDQTTWVRSDARFNVRVRVESRRRPAELELALTVFGRVPFRSQFAQTVEGRLLGSVLAHEAVRLTDATPASGDTVIASVVPPLRRAGVYPVRVELRDLNAEDPLGRLTTHLVYLPDETYAAPLEVAFVAPFNASPTVAPDGDVMLPEGRVAALTALGEALRNRPRLAASVLPSPDTLDALIAAPATSPERAALSAIAAAASGRPIHASTYVPAALDSLLDGGLVHEAEAQLSRASATTGRVLGRGAGSKTWIASGGISASTVEWLQARGFSRFVVPDGALEPVELSTTLTSPFELALASGDRPRAASIDAALAGHFVTAEQPVVAAHRVLADLAVIYLDHPGREGRGVVVAPPRGWRPDAAFLSAFLNGLATSPVLASTTVDDFLETPPAAAGGNALARRFSDDTGPSLPIAAIDRARSRLESFATIVEEESGRYLEFERLLLSAQALGIGAGRRSAYLDGFHDALGAELDLVEIPDRQSVRLTAREGAVPISILNHTGYPVRVLVRVEGDTLEFPQGEERLVSLTHETTTERIPVHARSSGAFPLRVTVLSPDGGLAVSTSRFTVTSTAASWVGLVLSAGAALFLIVWWGRHIHGRRSGKLIPT